MYSIKRRLLSLGSFIIVIFLLITAFTLEKAFRSVAEQARNERLHANVFTILAAAELEEGKLQIPEILPEQKLMLPDSGLFAYVIDEHNKLVWSSQSSLGSETPEIIFMHPGQESYSEISTPLQMKMLQFGVAWQSYDQKEYKFTITVVEDSIGFNEQIASYRENLYGWLAALGIALVLVQIFILRWGLHPLSRVEVDIRNIEAGKTERLSGKYPKEISGITTNLNILVENERKRLAQYRDTLANLAHSLKTPLAVLRSEVEQSGLNHSMLEQVDRIDSMVEYQLSRAALSGRITYTTAIKVLPIAIKLISALDKVFVEKGIRGKLTCSADVEINAVEGDVMEILGNLLDNAYKWAESSVWLNIEQLIHDECRVKGAKIVVEDDGPGIDPAAIDRVLIRGGREDTTTPGHGIGLAVVKDLIDSYLGTLDIDNGRQGGALITIEIPPR
ncbi:MAG: hypothetical protein D6B28_08065 [Gammaproteobacteria bacterium]|nr:MAG: hypothetical protein D6B28_08065 [Gammaproteobacteria bacterium]